ncbi:MAG: hypothetical protein F6K30_05905 [Cyanothece sp. SIO2G6]|nr:hypothetical protein [Cyanothece sp. SIO2G6]
MAGGRVRDRIPPSLSRDSSVAHFRIYGIAIIGNTGGKGGDRKMAVIHM